MSIGDAILLVDLFLSYTFVKRDIKKKNGRRDKNANILETCNWILNAQVMKCTHFSSI